jgi:predicted RND superfamily exporter protein
MQIDDKEYNGKDFDVIRKIICEQNAIELPDETTHPDVVKAYKEMEEYKRKQSKVKICSFEDQINVVVAKSSYRREEVVKMTIRSFTRLLERIDKVLHYEIYTLLSPNMDKKGQQSIEHYMSDSSIKDKYKNSMMDFDEFKNKIK